jgi:hypothetical protein
MRIAAYILAIDRVAKVYKHARHLRVTGSGYAQSTETRTDDSDDLSCRSTPLLTTRRPSRR